MSLILFIPESVGRQVADPRSACQGKRWISHIISPSTYDVIRTTLIFLFSSSQTRSRPVTTPLPLPPSQLFLLSSTFLSILTADRMKLTLLIMIFTVIKSMLYLIFDINVKKKWNKIIGRHFFFFHTYPLLSSSQKIIDAIRFPRFSNSNF